MNMSNIKDKRSKIDDLTESGLIFHNVNGYRVVMRLADKVQWKEGRQLRRAE